MSGNQNVPFVDSDLMTRESQRKLKELIKGAAVSGGGNVKTPALRYLSAQSLRPIHVDLLSLACSPYTSLAGGNTEHAYHTPIYIQGGFGPEGWRYVSGSAPYPTMYSLSGATVSIGSPCIVSLGSGISPPVGTVFNLTTTGALPAGLTAGNSYYVLANGWTADNFQVSATPGGSPINTSGSQSGAHTFKLSAAKYENPCCYVSNDGVNWTTPKGLINPIADGRVLTENGGLSYYFDPYLTLGPDNRVYMIWGCTQRGAPAYKTVFISSSSDLINWTLPVSIFDSNVNTWNSNSPSIFHDGTQWVMLCIETDNSPYKIYRRTTSNATPESGWSTWTLVNAPHPRGKAWWHAHFIRLDNGTVIGGAADNNASGGQGYILVSNDNGLNFSATPLAHTNATAAGTFYRPSFCSKPDGVEMYVTRIAPVEKSGFQVQRWLMRDDGPAIRGIRAAQRDALARGAIVVHKSALLAYDTFTRADSSSGLGTSDSGHAWAAGAGTWAITSNQATIQNTGNNIAVVDLAASDYEFEIQVATLGVSLYIVFGFSDSANMMRWALPAGQVQRISGGAIASSYIQQAWQSVVAGSICMVRKRGSYFGLYIDDMLVDEFNDPALAANTKVGFQASGAVPSVIDNMLARLPL